MPTVLKWESVEFQSTPPHEGGDGIRAAGHRLEHNFNPRPPRGGRRQRKEILRPEGRISIHAPHEGGDG